MPALYLITGGCGFLGSEIVRQLVHRGRQVRVFALADDPQCKQLPAQAEVFTGNIVTGEGLDAFMTVPEGTPKVVIHTAGFISLAPERDQRLFDINIEGTRQVVNHCLLKGVDRLVHVASVHAITELPKEQQMKEPIAYEPDTVVGWYAKTKTEACRYVTDAVQKKGLNASIVFPSGIWGPGDWKQGNLIQLFKDYWYGKIPAGVQGGYNFVDVRDAAQGIIACADQDKAGENYILAGHYVTVRQILDTFQRVTGKPPVRCILPMWLAKAALPFLQLGSKLSGKPPIYTQYALYTLGANADFSIEKAKRDLGFHPRPFETSLRDTFVWLRDNGLLS